MKRYTLQIFCWLILFSQLSTLFAQGDAITFTVTGDIPYGATQNANLSSYIANHNLYSQSEFIIHIGDIKTGGSACVNQYYQDAHDIMLDAAVPVFIIPGDNEWNDCVDPNAAWILWEQYFYNYEDKFCGTPDVMHQSVRHENFAFIESGVLFIGLNMVGGAIHDVSVWEDFMADGAAWIDTNFTNYKDSVRAAVIFSHAGPGRTIHEQFFDPFEISASSFAKPVLFINGDLHYWLEDDPFTVATNVHRIQIAEGEIEQPLEVTITTDPVNWFSYVRNPYNGSPTIYNAQPCIEIGSDTTLAGFLPINFTTTSRASDDGVPLSPGAYTTTWRQISGIDTAIFNSTTVIQPEITFPTYGTYTFELLVDDGELETADTLTIIAGAPSPFFTINDTTVLEGDTGTQLLQFTVTLNSPNGSTSTVNYQTADSTALNPSDYISASGTLNFPVGTTTQPIDITISSDSEIESDEFFKVHLSGSVNADINDSTGVGTIQTDDFPSPPVIGAFSPDSADIGQEITVIGSHFEQITALAVAGVTVDSFVVDSTSQLRLIVPDSATTGTIRVTTTAGPTESADTLTIIKNLTITQNTGGTIAANPGGGVYSDSTLVILTATADSAYRFSNWNGNLSGSENPDTLLMTDHFSVSATFIRQYSLTAQTIGSGSVNFDPAGGIYDSASTITLSATPAAGFIFTGWSGDSTSSESSLDITMDGDKNITANFVDITTQQFDLTVNTSGFGSVQLAPAGGTYFGGSTVTLTPIPANGFVFTGWSGDLQGNANPDSINIDGDKTVTANFVQQGSLAPTVVAIDTGSSSGLFTVSTTGNVAAVDDQLYLASITTKSQEDVDVVTGLGLTWTRVHAQCSGRSHTGLEVWMAIGTPSGDGVVTATFLDDPSHAIIAVSRYQYVNPANPLGNTIAGNTLGENGACSGGSDGNSFSFNLTTTDERSLIFAAVGSRNKSLTPGAGYTELLDKSHGSTASNRANLGLQEMAPGAAATYAVDGSFNGSADWSVIAIEINPYTIASDTSFVLTTQTNGSGSISLDPSGGTYDSATVVILTATPDSANIFTGWSDSLSGDLNPNSLFMDNGKVVTANFLRRFLVTSNVSGNGSITISPDTSGGIYDSATVVTFTANADSGYRFSGWSGDISSSDTTDSLIINSDKSITANFVPLYSFNTTPAANGSITISPDTSGGVYDSATVVTLTAVPDSGFAFAEWSGDYSGFTNPDSVSVDSNMTISAIFRTEYQLTTNIRGGGNLTLSPPGGLYPSDMTVVLSAIADSGYSFSHWEDAITSTANPDSVVMDSNTVVNAVFIPTYQLTLMPDAGGAVQFAPDTTIFDSATTVTITALPDSAYRFAQWSGDLSSVDNPDSLVMNADKSFAVDFIRLYSLSTSTVSQGAIAISPDTSGGLYDSLTTISFTAIPDSGYRFTGWSGSLNSTSLNDSIVIDSNSSVTANFIPLYQLSTSVLGFGNITISPDTSAGIYDSATVITLTATPDSGYTFAGWSGDLSSLNSIDSLQIDSNLAITATFIPAYSLITNSDNGSINLSPSGGIYDSATVVTLTAVADSGFLFSHWSGDLSSSTNPDSLVIDTNLTVTAHFIPAFTLFNNVVGNGNIVLNPAGGIYDSATVVTLTAAADSGNAFIGWSGDLSGIENPDSLIINSDKSVTATFTPTYEIALTTSNGNVTMDPPGGIYDSATVVTLSAVPDSAYRFNSWNGDLSGSNNPDSVQVDSNLTIGAEFTRQFLLSSNITGAGSLQFSPDTSNGGVYDSSTVVTITPVADSGFVFLGWAGALSGNASPDSVTMDADREVTAIFIPQYPLSVTTIGQGTVDQSPSGSLHDSATVISFTAIPDSGYRFVEWSEDLSGNVSPDSLIMDSTKSVTATFELIPAQFTLSIAIDGQGSAIPSPAQASYDTAAFVTLTAQPDSGYVFAGWSGDLSSSNNPDSVQMTANRNVTASFIPSYSLDLVADNGNITAEPSGSIFDSATVVTLTAVSDSAYRFSAWSGDLSGSNNPDSITMNANKSVTADFIRQYRLTADGGNGGSINFNPDTTGGGIYDSATVVHFTAVPDSGYRFNGWSGDLSGSENPDSIAMLADRNITANFLAEYTLAVNVSNGSVSLSPPGGIYDSATVVTIIATPDSGFVFDSWSGDSSSTSDTLQIVMDSDKTLTAGMVSWTTVSFDVSVTYTGSGTVVLDPPGGTYTGGTMVTFTPQAASGYEFLSWSGDLSGSNNPDSLLITANTSVIANFFEGHRLTINTAGPGIVNADTSDTLFTSPTDVTLTAVPDPGYSFEGWSGNLSGTDNPATVNVNGATSVTASFVQYGIQSIVREEIVTGTVSDNTLLTTAGNVTAATNQLYLAVLNSKPVESVTSVSGMGLTWTQVREQCSGGDKSGAAVWMAIGTPSGDGVVSAVYDKAPDHAMIAVVRYSGVDKDNPVGPVVSGNRIGENGACSGGSNTNSYSFNLTTTEDSMLVFNMAGIRNRTHTPGSGFTEFFEQDYGSSNSNRVTLVMQEKLVSAAAVTTVDGTLSGTVDWSAIGLAIKPGRGTPAYSLTTSTVGLGSIDATPAGSELDSATVVTLTAVPGFEYVFSGWSGDLSGNSLTDSVTMNFHKNVTATFTSITELQYSLTVDTVGNGGITLDPPGGVYYGGTYVTLTAAPDAGQRFVNWSGDLASTNLVDSIYINGEKTVTGTFEEIPTQFALNTFSNGNGSVSLDSPSGIYDTAAVAILTAVPDSGYYFTGWSGDLSGTANPDSIVMDTVKSVTASFELIPTQFNLTANATNGSILANPSTATYDSAATVTLTAVPDSAYRFVNWSDDLSGNANPDSVVMDSHKTVTANFLRQFSLVLNTSGPGSIQKATSDSIFDSLSVVTLTAVPDSGFFFLGWSGGLSGNATTDSVTMDTNQTVTATFIPAPSKFTLNLDTLGMGTVTANPAVGPYDSTAQIILTATPGTDWVFAGFKETATDSILTDTITIHKDLDVTAMFLPRPEPQISGIWTSAAEIALRDTLGAPWFKLLQTANLPHDEPDLSEQNETANLELLAKALVYVRTGTESYRQEVISGVISAIGTQSGGRTLALGRKLMGYIIAAELVGLPAAEDSTFKQFLRDVRYEVLDSRTLISTHEDRPNNWGTYAGASRSAIARYLNDDEELFRSAMIMRAWLGDRDYYASFQYGSDLSWQADSANPVGINPLGSTIQGHDVSGVLPDDQRREVPFTWPPPQERYVYEGLQGAVAHAIILHRAGFNVWDWEDQAIKRAFDWLHNYPDFPAAGDDVWLPFSVNEYLGTNYPVLSPIPEQGKNMGWTDWLHNDKFSIVVYDTAHATVTLEDSSNAYDSLDTVILTAIPDSGYRFLSWNRDLSGSENPDTLLIDGYKEVGLNLVRLFSLNAQATSGGSITFNPDTTGGAIYDSATVVTLTAIPDSGYLFQGWSGDYTSSSLTDSVQLDSNITIQANFQPAVSLVITGSNGVVALDPPGGFYDSSTVVTLTATADSAYRFDRWSGNLSSTANPDSVTMDSSMIINANFIRQFTLSANSPLNGNIIITPDTTGGSLYDSATVVTFTAVPDSGFTFAGWSGALNSNAAIDSVSIDSNTTVSASFIPQYQLTSSVVGNGAVSFTPDTTGGGIYDSATVVTMTATPDSGYLFAEWSGGLSGSANPDSVTMDSSIHIGALFREGKVLSIISNLGSVSLNPPGGVYDSATVVTLTATPDSAYRFLNWSGDLTSSENPDSISMDSSQSVTANYIRQYSLTASTIGNGAIAFNPDTSGGAVYDSNSVVTLTAIPDSGFAFAGWSGALSGNVSTDSVNIDSNTTITARFIPRYQLISSVVGNGSITFDPDTSGGAVYDSATVVSISAIPDSGFIFAGWSGDFVGNLATDSLQMDSTITLQALFTPGFTLTTTSNHGSVVLSPSGGSYDSATVVTLTAIPDSGYSFREWTGDLSSVTNPDSVTMDSSMSIQANFIRQFQLISSVIGNGSIGFSPDTTDGAIFDSATVVTLTATPDSGYSFAGWSGDLISASNQDSVTMDSSITVQALFVPAYVLTMNASNGSVALDPAGGIYDSATVVTMTATADSAYRFDSWSGNYSSSENPDSVAMDSSITINANFIRQFSLLANTIGGGNIAFSPDTTGGAIYDSATVVTFTATPDSGYTFVGWSGALSGNALTDSVNIDSNTTVTATFIRKFQLTSSVVGNGSIGFSPDTTGGAIYDSATVVTLTATPDPGYAFAGWSGDLNSNANPDSVTMDSSISIQALFVPAYVLTMNASNGIVALDPAGGVYDSATVVTMTATADSAYRFDSWNGDYSSSENPDSVTMDSSIAINANFIRQFSLLANTIGGGNIAFSPDTTGGAIYDSATVITFTATPDSGYTFAGWSGALSGNALTDSVNIDSNTTVTATFIRQFQLTSSVVGNGSTGFSPDTTGGAIYDSATVVTLTATPEAGYSFAGWSGDLNSNANPDSVTMDSSINVQALFVPAYVLTMSASNGSVALDPAGGIYDSATVVTMTATADSAYRFDSWSGDYSSSENPDSVTMDSSITINANFIRQFSLLANTIGGGNIAFSPDTTVGAIYDSATVVTFTATPDSGYTFAGWSGALSGNALTDSVNIDSNTTVTATFIRQFQLTSSVVGNGSIGFSPDTTGGAIYDSSTVVTLTATPEAGYSFAGWSGDLNSSANPDSVTMDSSITIQALFVPAYVLTMNASNGIVALDPASGIYDSATVVTMTATADSAYRFDSWNGDYSSSENPDSVTLDSSITINANFIRQFSLIANTVGGGNIAFSPDTTGGAIYDSATVVTFTATPDSGYTFAGWSGALSGNSTTDSVNIDSNTTVTATFIRQFQLTSSVVGNGSIGFSPDTTGGAIYDSATVVTLTATPDPGYAFTGWSGDLNSNANPDSVTMDSSITIQALFVPAYVLTMNASNGSVALDPTGGIYDSATVVTMTATADSAYRFDSWSGDYGSSSNPDSVTMDSSIAINANFIRQFSLIANSGGGGNITFSPDTTGGAIYDSATVVTFTATPDSGYTFAGWSGALSGNALTDSVNIDSNTTVTATFIRQFQLTSSVVGNGSIGFSPDTTGGAIYDSATVATLTATPEAGYSFAGWSGDLNSNANPDSVTMDSSINVQALFVPAYVLTMNASNGSVALDPSGGIYDSATVVTFTATADSAYRFDSWNGDYSSSENPDSVTMDSSITINANFIRQFSLLANTIGGGNIVFSPDTTGGAIYDSATVVTFTATPDSGYTFAGWSGALSGNSTTDSVNIDSNTTVTATFIRQFQLSSSVVGNGSIVFSPDTTGGAIYDSATVVTLTATPEAGYSFAGWSGDLISASNPDSVIMDSSINVQALFVPAYVLTMNASNGSVALDPAGGVYDSATVVTFTASADSAYRFDSWSGDYSSSENPDSVTMDSSVTINANFIRQFSLIANTVGGGNIAFSPDTTGGAIYDSATVVTFTATPDSGYTFAGWSGALSGNSTTDSVNIDSNTTVTATFIRQFQLTSSVVGNGSIGFSPDTTGGAIYDSSTVVTLTATPEAGYSFAGWSGDLTSASNPDSVTMYSSINVQALFVPAYVLTMNASNGSVALDPAGGVYDSATVVTMTATADSAYRFDSWSGDYGSSTNPDSVTMDSSIAINANFIRQFSLIANSGGGGNITFSPDTIGGAIYDSATVVTITATPDSGYTFAGWSGAFSGNALIDSVNIDSNTSVTATFSRQFQLTSSVVGNGNITFSPDTTGGAIYDSSTVVTLTATPDAGYAFAGWSGDLISASNPDSVTMDSSIAIQALFVPAYVLTMNASNGSVTLDPTGGIYDSATVVTFTATADSAYRFDSWSGDYGSSTNPDSVTMDSSISINANFIRQFSLLANTIGGGNIAFSPDTTGGAIYDSATVVTFTAAPDSGYTFAGWSGALSGNALTDSVNIDSNTTVTATFVRQFQLTSSVIGNGSIGFSPDTTGGAIYDSATVVTLTATPDAGYSFAGWSGDLNSNANPDSVTMDSSINVQALFVPAYVLTMNASNGSVALDPTGGIYDSATVVTMTATADSAYRFESWSGDYSSSENPDSVAMDSSITINANFIRQFSLLANTIGRGNIAFSPDTTGGAIYDSATVVTITATPDSGYTFAGWSGALSGNALTDSVNIDSNTTINATFIRQFQLTSLVVGNGSISFSPDTTGEAIYDSSTVVTLTATPDAGYSFAGWSGDLISSVNPDSVTMDSSISVQALFVPAYVLTMNASNGSVALDPAGGIYDSATVVTMTATADSAYRFDSWSGDYSSSENPDSVTMDSSITINANFIRQFSLLANTIGGGNITFSPDTTGGAIYDSATVVTITATPDSGYTFASWSGALSGNALIDSVNIDSNTSVTATFSRQFQLTSSVVGNGNITFSPDTTGGAIYDSATVVTLTATPDPGYAFAGWSGDLTSSATPDSVTMDSSITIQATFELIPIPIVNIRAFLEGPYNNSTMDTTLKAENKLPLTQPFATAPWHYTGGETVDTIPPGVVDWILIELRTGTGAETVIARRAAFILQNGLLIDTTGVENVSFPGVVPGSYYLVLRHRNHLAVMSAEPVMLSDTTEVYDFTGAQSQAFGSDAMKELTPSNFGLYSGDSNSDGTIDSEDKENYWRIENATIWEYGKRSDYNLDGGIDVTDKNFFWSPNIGISTEVPDSTMSSNPGNGNSRNGSGSTDLNGENNRSNQEKQKGQKNSAKSAANSDRAKGSRE